MFKILIFYPFVMGKPSGGDRSFIETVKRWSLWGNQIHIVTTSTGFKLLKQNQVEFVPYVFGAPGLNSGWREFLGSHMREIVQFLHTPRGEFDFIYCPSEMVAFIIPSILAKMKLKIPLVIRFQQLREHEPCFFSCLKYLTLNESKPFLRPIAVSLDLMIRNFFAKIADLALVLSNYDRKILLKMGLSPTRIRITKNGVNQKQIAEVTAGPKVFDACFLGNITPRKGALDLVEIWKKVVKYKSFSRLAIIGIGSEETLDKLNSMIAEFNMKQNVILLGWLDGADKYAIMKKSRIFIFPSYGEAFPLAVCEAMACGLPVVAYDLPQLREIYRKGMIRAEIGNVTKFTPIVKMLLENQNMREELSKDALEQAKEYDWDKTARKELEIISESAFPSSNLAYA